MSDLSRSSDDTLRAAARIAHAAAADLHVVHAMGLVGLAIGEALVMLHESNIRRTRGALEKQLERALPESRRPTTYGLDYQSAQLAIQHRAKEVRADLVVIGPLEPSAPGLRPSVLPLSEAAGRTGAPVLVVRAPLTWPPRRVLLPVDHAAVADGAVRLASRWLSGVLAGANGSRRSRDAVLRVLHLARRLDAWRELAPVLDAEVRRAEAAVEASVGLRIRRTVRWGGTAVESILNLAATTRSDLVVVSGDRTGRERTFTDGDPARRIVREAPCNVLVLPDGRRAGEHRRADRGQLTPTLDPSFGPDESRVPRPGVLTGPAAD